VLTAGELAVRVLLAALVGAALGFERELSDQPAGLRTHILVSLGAALFTLVGIAGPVLTGASESLQVDPTRIAAQVVTGIGFLGAGAILQQGLSIRGLTTAAALWVTAAMGTAVGLGYYTAAVMTLVTSLVVLLALKPLERTVLHRVTRVRRRLIVETDERFRLADLRRALEDFGIAVRSVAMAENDERDQYILSVRLPAGASPQVAIDCASGVQGVAVAEWYS
jgi:putative Mg2+ transporter-C (MgtC) family protein